MKYAISLFMVLALIGAGCTGTTEPTPTPDTEEAMEAQETNENMGTEETMEEGEEASNEEQTEDETSEEQEEPTAEVTTDEGAVVTIETGDGAGGQTTGDKDNEEISNVILGGSPDITISMTTGNFFFNPSTITAAPGDRVLIEFASNSGTHDFVIDELNVDYDIEEGGNYIFTVPDEPGTYSYYCSIGSHRAMGMEGTLIIE
jgi:plastocyanin